MNKTPARIVDTDGKFRERPDFPMAVVREPASDEPTALEGIIVDPVLTYRMKDNLYGRIMTLVEATADPQKLDAVKDLFGKEIHLWYNDVYRDARSLAERASK